MTVKTKLILTCFFLVSLIGAQTKEKEKFTVSGKCIVSEPGELYIFLVDEEAFKIPLTGYKKLVIKVTPNHVVERYIDFSFNALEKGKYGIRCFLDTNNNAKLDKGLFGPKEPWGMSWQGDGYKGGFPKFNDIAFAVNKDINNIKILID